MAQVFTRGNTLWIHFSVDGKLYRKSLKVKNTKKNLSEAYNKASEIEEMLMNNVIPRDEDIAIKKTVKKEFTVPDSFKSLDYAFDMFLSNNDFNKKNRTMYENAFKKFKEVIDTSMPCNEITEFHYTTFTRYMKEKKLAYNTMRTYINYMNIFINKSNLYKDKNPFKRLKKQKKPYIETIKEEHFALILDYLKEHNTELYRIIYFLKLTGFRLNEATTLTWDQIKFDEDVINVKTHKDNRYDLFPLNIENGKLKDFLLSFRKESGKIFDVNPEWIRQPFQNAISKINEARLKEDKNWQSIPKHTIHQIRKTFGSYYYDKMMPIELKTLMRHKDVSTTLDYYIKTDVTDIVKRLNNR